MLSTDTPVQNDIRVTTQRTERHYSRVRSQGRTGRHEGIAHVGAGRHAGRCVLHYVAARCAVLQPRCRSAWHCSVTVQLRDTHAGAQGRRTLVMDRTRTVIYSGYPCLTFAYNNAPYSCDSLVHSSSHSSNDMWLYTLFFECHMIIHLILRMPYDYAPYSSNASTPFRRSSQDSYPPQERGAASHSLHSKAPTPTVPGGGCVGHSSAMPCHAVSTRDGD